MRRGLMAGALLAAILVACGGGATGSPTATPETPLVAGTYTSAAFQPAVTFTVPDGWILASDTAGYLQLRPAGQELVGIHLFRGAVAASQDPTCPVEPEPGVGTTSIDFVTWIRGLEGLSVSSPAMVTVDDLRGSSVDIAIAPDWTRSCPFANGLPTVPLLVEPGTGLRWVIAGGERLRLYVLDLPGGGTLLIDIDDFEGTQFDAFLAQAVPVVRSMQFATE